MSTHSMLSPSKTDRWARCPVSVYRASKYPETTSEYAEEGRRAHEFAAKILCEEKFTLSDYPDEMYGYVKTYVDTVLAMSQGASAKWVEVPIDLSRVLEVPDQKGTADFVAVVGKEVQVHDLKYGKGVHVDAHDNPQLILYALGVLDFISLVTDDIETVRIAIHQPRVRNDVSEVVYTVSEMAEWSKKLRRAALTAKNAYDVLYHNGGKYDGLDGQPGTIQCRWCPAKADCPDLQKVCAAAVDEFDEKEISEKVAAQTNEVLGSNLVLLPLIKLWAAAVDEAAMSRAVSGEKIPGFKLVEGRAGNRMWSDKEQAEDAMKSMRLKLDEMYTKNIISPTAAEKLLAKNAPKKWERLREYVTRTPPKPTLVPESDKRPEIILAATADEFDVALPF